MKDLVIRVNDWESKFVDKVLDEYRSSDITSDSMMLGRAINQLYFRGIKDDDVINLKLPRNFYSGKSDKSRHYNLNDLAGKHLDGLCQRYGATKKDIVMLSLLYFDKIGLMEETFNYDFYGVFEKFR